MYIHLLFYNNLDMFIFYHDRSVNLKRTSIYYCNTFRTRPQHVPNLKEKDFSKSDHDLKKKLQSTRSISRFGSGSVKIWLLDPIVIRSMSVANFD